MASLLYRKCLHFDFMVHNLKHHQTGDKIYFGNLNIRWKPFVINMHKPKSNNMSCFLLRNTRTISLMYIIISDITVIPPPLSQVLLPDVMPS